MVRGRVGTRAGRAALAAFDISAGPAAVLPGEALLISARRASAPKPAVEVAGGAPPEPVSAQSFVQSFVPLRTRWDQRMAVAVEERWVEGRGAKLATSTPCRAVQIKAAAVAPLAIAVEGLPDAFIPNSLNSLSFSPPASRPGPCDAPSAASSSPSAADAATAASL